MNFKTGLLPSPEPPRLRFGTYLQLGVLPAPPPTFGLESVYPTDGWGMLGNDKIGNCTVAGAMHISMLWRAMVNSPVCFTALDAEDDYYAITGGDDTGADMVQQAKYWQSVGFRDSTNTRHKILAYMHVDANNLDHVDAACYLFGAVGLGIGVGPYEETTFQHKQPWLYSASTIDGYHYVPMIGKNPQYRQVVTWGGLQNVGEAWFKGRVQEVVAVLTDENLTAGKSLEGFDIDELMADLENVGQ